MIIIDYLGLINTAMLLQQIRAQLPVVEGITWDETGQTIAVSGATEVERAQIEAIVAAHDPTQITQAQQERNRRAIDKAARYNELRQSPRAYRILEGDTGQPLTNDDIGVLADIVRYMFNELGIDMPDWTLAARS